MFKQKCLDRLVALAFLFFIFVHFQSSLAGHHQHHSQNDVSPPTWYLDGTTSSYLQFSSWNHFFAKRSRSSSSTSNTSPDEQDISIRSILSEASISFDFRYQLDNSTISRPLGGLILYSDDETGIGGSFLEIKLLSDSNLRVRIDDNSVVRPKNIIELRQEINFTDGNWHRLELTRHFQSTQQDNHDFMLMVNYDERLESITLTVDSETIHKKIELSSTVPGYGIQPEQCRHRNRAVFIGGVPEDYRYNNKNLAHLALPTVAYELHFRGAIRNVYYSYITKNDPTNNQRPQLPVATSGLLEPEMASKQDQECDPILDRCKHGGYCYTTKNGVYCDCSVTDFDGTYCQNEKRLPEATFHGTLGEYLGYNHLEYPNAWSLVSSHESFQLGFRTKNANGLLLLTSDEYEDYLAITIRDAGLSLTMKLGPNLHERTIKPTKVRFDDNQWHTVLVWRRIREISPSTYFCHFSISVDGIYTQYGSTASTVSYLVSKVFYVGGIAHNSAVEASNPITAGSNFVGCLRKIILTADNVRLDLLEILQQNSVMDENSGGGSRRSKLVPGVSPPKTAATSNLLMNDHDDGGGGGGLIRFYGNRSRSSSLMLCEDVDISDPITFTTSDSYLKLNGWNSPKEGTISLKLRTNEANGLLLYSDGSPEMTNHSATRDYFAMELLDGHLYLLLNLGASPLKVKATKKRIDDSHWHTVTVRRSDRSGQVMVDDAHSDFVSAGQSNRLDLGDALYLGGVPHYTGHKLTYTPPELWSASLGFGYIGCVRDLFINDRIIDIATHARRQDSGSIRPSCHSLSSQCANQPCQNGGQCTEGWNRYSCDCTNTAYTGSVCTKNAATVTFNGEQYVSIMLPEELQTQAESISLRFRTGHPNGLLMTTSHPNIDNSMTISLEDGSIRIDFNFGSEAIMERVAVMGNKLNDDIWHGIRLERRGPNLAIALDSVTKQVVELTGQHFTLHLNTIHVGARRFNAHHHRMKQPHIPGFIGQMQNFVFNGQAYFEKIRDGHLPNGSIQITAKLGKKDRVLHNAVTFKSKYTFVGLPQLKAYSRLDVYFQFKTRESNGLILFNGGGHRHDFIALELVNGQLHYLFDMGDGPRRLQSNSRTMLNDNRWHTVTLGRPSLHQHTMLVDDMLITANTNGNERNLHLDLDGLLYFGGVRDNMWPLLPKAIRSRNGYEGCIASLDLNGETYNLVGKEVLIPSTLVESGCSAPIARCSSTACANRGICVQLWNSYTCDCDLTTFSGPTCADGNESTAYQFGPNPGLISFTFDENNRPDTRNDLLALGFLTTKKDGALVRVDSATTADYFQLELIDGNVLVVYNLGTEDIDIGDLGIKVNDGKYHIVRFTRSGQNSTLQIDNHNVITRSPTGKQLNIFNRHAYIQIGGHKNVLRGVIEKPFIGIIAGLVFNGHRLLDMAAEDDPRIKIEGDVELMISIGNQQTVMTSSTNEPLDNQMLSEPKSPSYGSGDDLIHSSAGSGCFDVNEDEECAHIANEGSGDDLITPVYVSVNRFRPTPASSYGSSRNRNDGWRRPCQNDDDDDCFEGSGEQPRHQYPYNYSHNYNTDNNNYYTTVRPWMVTTWTAPTVPPMIRPPFSNVPGSIPSYYNTPPTYYGGSGPFGPQPPSLMRPKTTAPVYSVSGPNRPIITPPIESPDPPEINEVPLIRTDYGLNQSMIEPPIDDILPEVMSQASSDRTVIIISAIAILLILVVVIGPIVLFYKVRYSATQSAYKIETFGGQKIPATGTIPLGGSLYGTYSGSPVVRATSVSGITGHSGTMNMIPPGAHGINSLGRPMSRPGTRPGTPTHEMAPGVKKKDPHEWYV